LLSLALKPWVKASAEAIDELEPDELRHTQEWDVVLENPILNMPGVGCYGDAANAIVVAELVRQCGGTAARVF
jgi:hypothetical protein